MATIALIGPDGAGKTTIARRLEARQPLPVKYLYMGVNAGAGNVTLPTSRLLHRLRERTRAPGAAPAGTPAGDGGHRSDTTIGHAPRVRRGSLWSLARLLHHLAEEWYRQLACWWYELSGNVVVCDRHFVFDYAPEIATGAASFDRSVRRWIFTHLYPAPDLVIFLDAPAHVLYARKGDATVPELERRRRAYLEMGKRCGSFVRVDATLALDDVYEQVAAHILRFHAVRARVVCKALDAAVTAGLLVPHRAAPTLRSVVRRKGSSYERVRGLVRASDAVIPGTARRIRHALLRPARLPFDATAELVGFGSGSTVFRLDDGDRTARRVLKVYRRSLDQRPETLQRLAREFRAKYTTIRTWYDSAGVVVPTHFAILHSPVLGFPAVACVQPYIADAGEDFLARPDHEVLALLHAHPSLREQFRAFAACTLRVFELEQRCIDLLGHGNLALTGSGSGGASGTPRLWLLDFGVYALTPGAATPPQTTRRLLELVERIRMLDTAAAAFSNARARAGVAS